MTFDLEDAVKRGCLYEGMPSRVLCADLAPHNHVVLAVSGPSGEWIKVVRRDGHSLDTGYSAQNLPREVTVWVAVRESGGHETYRNEMMARGWCDRQRARGNAAGCAPVTITLKR